MRKRRERKGVRGGEVEWEGVDIARSGATFSLVYATPLLQHRAQFGLIPALDFSFRLFSGYF